MNNSFTHCPISNAVTSHPLLQQHSLDQVVVYKYPSYQWDHAVTLSVERREENKKRVGIEIFIRLYVTIYSIVLLQNYSSREYYKQAS